MTKEEVVKSACEVALGMLNPCHAHEKGTPGLACWSQEEGEVLSRAKAFHLGSPTVATSVPGAQPLGAKPRSPTDY